jgi:hypothetical protein
VNPASGRRPALLVAMAATVLCLGVPIVPGLSGREFEARVLLVGAVVLIALALGAARRRQREGHLVVAALFLLGLTTAILIRALTPSGAVLLSIAIGALLWQRREWARR